MKKFKAKNVMLTLASVFLISGCSNENLNDEAQNNSETEIKSEIPNEIPTDSKVADANTKMTEVIEDNEAKLKDEYIELYKKFKRTTIGYEDELLTNGESSKTGVLYDFDNDGLEELLTFYVAQNEGEDFVGYNLCVYDTINEDIVSTSYLGESGYNVSNANKEFIYISNKGYIIHRTYELGYGYKVIEYRDGLLQEIDNISFIDASEVPIYYKTEKESAPTEISRDDFEKLSDQYGIYDIAKIIMIDDNSGYTPNSEEIPFKAFTGEMVADNELDQLIK